MEATLFGVEWVHGVVKGPRVHAVEFVVNGVDLECSKIFLHVIFEARVYFLVYFVGGDDHVKKIHHFSFIADFIIMNFFSAALSVS